MILIQELILTNARELLSHDRNGRAQPTMYHNSYTLCINSIIDKCSVQKCFSEGDERAC